MLIVTPAYGRKYDNPDAAVADWEADMDWVIASVIHQGQGRYVNMSGAAEYLPDEDIKIDYAPGEFVLIKSGQAVADDSYLD